MRVLIYEGDSFLGSHIADRFHKEGHDVICIYTHGRGKGAYPVTAHTKYRYSGTPGHIERIVKNERPHAIVCVRADEARDVGSVQEAVPAYMQLLDASVKYHVERFILVSSVSVYGGEPRDFTETDPLAPETHDAKLHALCEDCLMSWRSGPAYKNVILRMAELYGPRQDTGCGSVIWRMIGQAENEKSIRTGLDGEYSLLYCGDAAEAVYLSTNEFASGIYNITPDRTVTGSELAEYIGQSFVISPPIAVPVTAEASNADNTRAKKELGFIWRIDPRRGVELCCDWQKRSESAGRGRERDGEKKKSERWLYKYTETVIFFLIAAFLTYLQAGWSTATTVNFLTLYIILIGALLGINYAVLAAVLVSCFNIFTSVMNGMGLVSSLYDMNTMILVVENLIIGVSIGYVVDRKDGLIAQKEEVISDQSADLQYLNQLYDEMADVKSELEFRISEYKDSYGKINHIINSLKSTAPEEVFVNSLHVIKDLIHEDHISLFILDGKMLFARRTAFIGEECTRIPKTFRLRDFPKISDIIEKRELYANRFLDTELPSMIIPIVYGDKVLSMLVIHNMEFDKLNLYYVNLMRIVANLINTAFAQAQEYELAVISKRFLPDTPILLPDEFNKQITIKGKMAESSNYVFTMLEVEGISSEEEMIEKSFTVSGLVRSNDVIGMTEQKRLRILLSATSEAYSENVITRLAEAGVRAFVVKSGEAGND